MREATRAETAWLLTGGAVVIGGVFADGWAHSNILDELESFITPWHSIIFAGYLLTVTVVLMATRRRMSGPGRWLEAVPRAWKPAGLGVVVFAAGFLGDGLWHTIFGIEADLEALVSPTHLLMLFGGVAILGTPLGAAWTSSGGRRATWRSHGAVLASMVLVTLAAAFFLLWAWPQTGTWTTAEYAARNSGFAEGVGQALGLSNYLLWTLVMSGPVLLLVKRWDPPPGAVSMIVVLPPLLLLAALLEFTGWQRVFSFVAAGLAGEWIVSRYRPGPARPWAARALGVALPLVAYTADMAIVASTSGLGWPPEFVAGSVVFSSLLGLGLAFLAFSPVGAHEAVTTSHVDDPVPNRRS